MSYLLLLLLLLIHGVIYYYQMTELAKIDTWVNTRVQNEIHYFDNLVSLSRKLAVFERETMEEFAKCGCFLNSQPHKNK